MTQQMIDSSHVVYVVDDDPAILAAAARLIRASGFTVETFGSAVAFLARETSADVGCIVVDLSMPELGGLGLQERLLAAGVRYPIIFMSGCGDVASVTVAMKAGAVDFLVKPVDAGQLLAAISTALERSVAIYEQEVGQGYVRRLFDALTPCEKKVCMLVSEGRLNKQIASELETSEKTTKRHRGRVMHKLGVRSVADLVRLVDRVRSLDDVHLH